jgi:hypothetical protein
MKRKKLRINTTIATTCKISQNFDGSLLSLPSITVSNSPALSTTTTAFETSPLIADFAQKCENVITSENSPKSPFFRHKHHLRPSQTQQHLSPSLLLAKRAQKRQFYKKSPKSRKSIIYCPNNSGNLFSLHFRTQKRCDESLYDSTDPQ